MEDMQQIKSILPDLMRGGLVPPDVLMEVLTSKSLSSMKYKVQKAIKIKEEENNQIQQLSQQLQDSQKQLEQMQQQLKKATNKIEQLNEQKMQLEQHKIQLQYEIDRNKMKLKENIETIGMKLKNEKLRLKKTRCMMEILITIK